MSRRALDAEAWVSALLSSAKASPLHERDAEAAWAARRQRLMRRPGAAERRAAYGGEVRVCPARGSTAVRSRASSPRLSRAAEATLEAEYESRPYVELHEAGHAVVAEALGIRVGSISVVDRGDGLTRLDDDLDDPEQALMVLYAGLRAEKTMAGWNPDLEALWPRQHDTELIDAWIDHLELSPADEKALRARIVERVDELLQEHFTTLQRVADALVVNRTIMRDDWLADLFRDLR